MAKKTQAINVPESEFPRIVVVGGGFAGIHFAKAMKNQPYQVVLLDQNNFHQFQPLLYQVATCGIEADGIIYPLRKLFSRRGRFIFRMARVEKINAKKKELQLDVGRLSYDHLVVATGSTSNFFGNTEIEKHGIGMKTIQEALQIRTQVLECLEEASCSTDLVEREILTNFVIVGAGPSGVETAGALAEFKSHILEDDYPTLAPELMKIYLIQSGDIVLKGMSDHASQAAKADLEKMGVEILLGHRVTSYDGRMVKTDQGLELGARTLVWTAGVKGDVPAGVPEGTMERGNRIGIDGFLRVRDMPDVYAIGDVASLDDPEWEGGHPQVAQVAIQQGTHLAKNFAGELRGVESQPFVYNDRGSMATIGRRSAVADIGKWHSKGFIAWILWGVIHVLSLVGFRNRLLVFTSWLTNYFTYDRGNRFIVRLDDRHRK